MKNSQSKLNLKGIVFMFLFVLVSIGSLQAQNQTVVNEKKSFLELNVGIAKVGDFNNDNEVFSYFPGASVLFGQTFIYNDNTVFEYEVGLAFPTIATAKFGFGRKFDNLIWTAGIRPFPFNLYTQAEFNPTDSGSWTMSLEGNPLGSNDETIFNISAGNINFGYRWKLGQKNRRKSKHKKVAF
jgi:hypothetical protein